jgi:TPR repeat protein
MNNKKFKIIAILLASIIILLAIIFFSQIFSFFTNLFLGLIGFAALTIIFIRSLRLEDLISFLIIASIIPIILYSAKYSAKKEKEKSDKLAQDQDFLDNDLRSAMDDLFDNSIKIDSNKLIDIFTKASCIESSDWRVAYSSYLLGYLYSSKYHNIYDIKKAIIHYEAASKKGSKNGDLELGKLYFYGNEVEKNYDLAWSYFYKIKSSFPSESYMYLGLIHRCSENNNLSRATPSDKKAVEYLRKAISSDNPQPLASFKLGAMTYLGEGTEKNYEQAYSLMFHSVTTCFDSEVKYLAEMYFFGRGVQLNYGRALYYAIMADKLGSNCQKFIDEITNKASKSEIAEAYYDVSYSYSNDKSFQYTYLNKSHDLGYVNATIQIAAFHLNGVNEYFKIDAPKSFEFLKRLSDSGNAAAQTMLAEFYLKGEVVEKNAAEALQLLRHAADQGYVTAIGQLAYNQTFEEKRLSEDTFGLYKQAAELGNAYCCYIVGDLYLHGFFNNGKYEEIDFLNKDYQLAIQFFEKGSLLGDYDCQFSLGNIYYNGYESIKVDYVKSLFYFKESLKNGGTFSYKYLGLQYDLGLGTPINNTKAVYYYFKFLENYSDELVYHNIAHCYLMGEGVDKDAHKALAYYEKSAKLGFKSSVLAIAYLYFDEIHIEKDLIKSATWFYVAASLGFNESFEEIKKIKDQISNEGVEKSKQDAELMLIEINNTKDKPRA